eukprot:2645121-Rhodomonas_salina.3
MHRLCSGRLRTLVGKCSTRSAVYWCGRVQYSLQYSQYSAVRFQCALLFFFLHFPNWKYRLEHAEKKQSGANLVAPVCTGADPPSTRCAVLPSKARYSVLGTPTIPKRVIAGQAKTGVPGDLAQPLRKSNLHNLPRRKVQSTSCFPPP